MIFRKNQLHCNMKIYEKGKKEKGRNVINKFLLFRIPIFKKFTGTLSCFLRSLCSVSDKSRSKEIHLTFSEKVSRQRIRIIRNVWIKAQTGLEIFLDEDVFQTEHLEALNCAVFLFDPGSQKGNFQKFFVVNIMDMIIWNDVY
jgi:hypothetical protein